MIVQLSPVSCRTTMNKETSDRILVSLIYIQLSEIKKQIERRPSFAPTREEARAQLSIVERLFELAAGAVVTHKMERKTIVPLMELVDDIRDLYEWNLRTPS